MQRIPRISALALVIIALSLLFVIPSLISTTIMEYGSSREASHAVANIVEAGSSPGFGLALNASSITLGQGEDAAFLLTIAGANGFNETVALSSSIAPNPPGTSADGFSTKFSQNVVRVSPGQPTVRVFLTIMAYNLPPYLPAYPPLGSYKVTVFGTGQAAPLVVASTLLQVAVQPHMAAQPRLLYQLGYKGGPYPGATIQLSGSFTNLGNVQLRVTWLGFAGDFGRFNATSQLPLSLYPDEKKTVSMNFTIPSEMPMGSHVISATANWQYYVPNYYDTVSNNFYPGGWGTGNSVVMSGSIAVVATSSPSSSNTTSSNTLASFFSTLRMIAGNPGFITGLTIYACFAGVAAVLVIRNDRRKIHDQRSPYPA